MKKIILHFVLFSSLTYYAPAQSLPQNDNLVVNGNFEEGNKSFTSQYDYGTDMVNPGNYAVTNNAQALNGAFKVQPHTSFGQGLYLVADAADEPKKIWCTSVKITSRSYYIFSLSAANINADLTNPPELKLTINDEPVGSVYTVKEGTWHKFNWSWDSQMIRDTARVCLTNINNVSTGSDLAIDDIALKKISGGNDDECPFGGDTIRNLVHFPFNESTLTEYSTQKLHKLLDMMRQCPAAKVKILGHADMHGNDDYNYRLSQQRTQVVKDFLISKGIAADRLITEAYGEKFLVYTGNYAKEHVKNRRIDFIILK